MPPTVKAKKNNDGIMGFADAKNPEYPIGLAPYCADGCYVLVPNQHMQIKWTHKCELTAQLVLQIFAEEKFDTYINISRGAVVQPPTCQMNGDMIECSAVLAGSESEFGISAYSLGWAAISQGRIYCGHEKPSPYEFPAILALSAIVLMWIAYFTRKFQ
jgi:hypothetical protein